MADRLEALKDLAEVLRLSIADVNPDFPEKRAPLAAQYRATLAEVAAIESAQQKAGDPIDEIAARRAARGA